MEFSGWIGRQTSTRPRTCGINGQWSQIPGSLHSYFKLCNPFAATSWLFRATNFPQLFNFAKLLLFWKIAVAMAIWESCQWREQSRLSRPNIQETGSVLGRTTVAKYSYFVYSLFLALYQTLTKTGFWYHSVKTGFCLVFLLLLFWSQGLLPALKFHSKDWVLTKPDEFFFFSNRIQFNKFRQHVSESCPLGCKPVSVTGFLRQTKPSPPPRLGYVYGCYS